jgi:hypothetical protein
MNENQTSPAPKDGQSLGSLNPVVRRPAFDADGYPTEDTLQHVVDWPYTDFNGLLDYVRIAVEGYGSMWEEKGAIKLATGGWSGNESIVGALQENRVFWAMCWESSHRGGLFAFRMPVAWPNGPQGPV